MNDKKVNLIMWLLMLLMLGYFAYSKGWILGGFQNLSPLEAKELSQKDKEAIWIDVRSREAFEKDTIVGAINFPLNQLENSVDGLMKFKNKKLLIFSERGEESVSASRLLSKHGFTVFNLKGGIVFWIRGGEKVIKK